LNLDKFYTDKRDTRYKYDDIKKDKRGHYNYLIKSFSFDLSIFSSRKFTKVMYKH